MLSQVQRISHRNIVQPSSQKLGISLTQDAPISSTAIPQRTPLPSYPGQRKPIDKEMLGWCDDGNKNSELSRFASEPAVTSSLQPPSSSGAKDYRCPRSNCDYIPKGEDRWKADKLRHHVRVQHAEERKQLICGYHG
jgi:hypothetical protein